MPKALSSSHWDNTDHSHFLLYFSNRWISYASTKAFFLMHVPPLHLTPATFSRPLQSQHTWPPSAWTQPSYHLRTSAKSSTPAPKPSSPPRGSHCRTRPNIAWSGAGLVAQNGEVWSPVRTYVSCRCAVLFGDSGWIMFVLCCVTRMWRE